MRKAIYAWLAEPLAREGAADRDTINNRRAVIRNKPTLNQVYCEWYRRISRAVPDHPSPVLELGAGPSFLQEYLPGLVTTDVVRADGIDLLTDAGALCVDDRSLRAIVMSGVLHHLVRPRRFFEEASRCLVPGGVVTMIEPWVTPFARLVWITVDHEPFDPCAESWEAPTTGPLAGANSALPWIIFSRDRRRFEGEFPRLSIESVEPFMPFRYLLSGGVSMRALLPGWAFGAVARLESALEPVADQLAMFAHITLRMR